jgi:hypothetical protein
MKKNFILLTAMIALATNVSVLGALGFGGSKVDSAIALTKDKDEAKKTKGIQNLLELLVVEKNKERLAKAENRQIKATEIGKIDGALADLIKRDPKGVVSVLLSTKNSEYSKNNSASIGSTEKDEARKVIRDFIKTIQSDSDSKTRKEIFETLFSHFSTSNYSEYFPRETVSVGSVYWSDAVKKDIMDLAKTYRNGNERVKILTWAAESSRYGKDQGAYYDSFCNSIGSIYKDKNTSAEEKKEAHAFALTHSINSNSGVGY